MEVDRAFRHTTLLLNLLLLVLVLLPVAAGLGLWWLRRSIIQQLVQMAADQAQKPMRTQAETIVAEVVAQQLTHYQITLAALAAQSRQALEQEWQKRFHTLAEVTEPVTKVPELQLSLQRLRQWLTQPTTELPPDLQPSLAQFSPDQPALSAGDCLLIGQVWQQLGQWESALAYYQQASQRQPESWEAWYHLGIALSHCQRYSEALSCFEKALSLQPEASQIYQQRAAVLEKLH